MGGMAQKEDNGADLAGDGGQKARAPDGPLLQRATGALNGSRTRARGRHNWRQHGRLTEGCEWESHMGKGGAGWWEELCVGRDTQTRTHRGTKSKQDGYFPEWQGG